MDRGQTDELEVCASAVCLGMVMDGPLLLTARYVWNVQGVKRADGAERQRSARQTLDTLLGSDSNHLLVCLWFLYHDEPKLFVSCQHSLVI